MRISGNNHIAAHRFTTHGITLFGWAYLLVIFGAILLDIPIRYFREKKPRWALAALLTLMGGIVLHSQIGHRNALEVSEWHPAQFDYIWCVTSWYVILGVLMLPFRLHRLIAAKNAATAIIS